MKLNCLLILAVWLMAGCGSDVDKWPRVPFDQKKWMEAKEVNRFVFVKDLIERGGLKGKTVDEIIELLGPPTYKDEKVEYITYVVKAESGNLYILDIRFKVEKGKSVVELVGVRSD